MHIITKKIDEARNDNPSWDADKNFPKNSNNGPLPEEEKEQKRLRKIAYVYDDIMKFKKFLIKRERALQLIVVKTDEAAFIEKMNKFVDAEENEKLMTAEKKEYVEKKQIIHSRFRREGIDETKRPEETNIQPNRLGPGNHGSWPGNHGSGRNSGMYQDKKGAYKF